MSSVHSANKSGNHIIGWRRALTGASSKMSLLPSDDSCMMKRAPKPGGTHGCLPHFQPCLLLFEGLGRTFRSELIPPQFLVAERRVYGRSGWTRNSVKEGRLLPEACLKERECD
ncbi:hypothetical protein MHYP_G00273080 [Metynnis hypsauchen]